MEIEKIEESVSLRIGWLGLKYQLFLSSTVSFGKVLT